MQQQKALLEVYFLLYYNRLFPNGKSFLSVLQYVQTTVWGSLQANESLFDPEAQALAQDVVALSHLILIENMNLERAAFPEAEELNLVPGQQLAEEEILHPKTLERIHQLIIALVSSHPRQSALLALAWAFVLFRITESISSVPLPETYYDIAQQILPADLQPRKDAKCAQANASQQALWQLLVTHALSPHVACLSFMLEILSSPLLSSNISFSLPTIPSLDPNLAGYLSVLRSVLASLSRLVHPSYLPSNDFDSLVAVFEILYANPEAGLLRGNFWGLFAEAEDSPIREEEWQIFEVAAKRFPVEMMPFTRMILALSGGRSPQLLTSPLQFDETDEAAALSQNCAEQTMQYLGQPQALTQALPSLSPVMPLPYELSKSINATATDIIATRPIRLSPSLTISPGTAGRIVSPLDQRPLIVSWDLSRSVDPSLSTFRFYGDCLKAFLADSQKKRPAKNGGSLTGSNDVFEGSHSHGIPESFMRTMDKNLSDLAYIVAMSVYRVSFSVGLWRTNPCEPLADCGISYSKRPGRRRPC